MVQNLSERGLQLDIAGHMGMGAVVQRGEPAMSTKGCFGRILGLHKGSMLLGQRQGPWTAKRFRL